MTLDMFIIETKSKRGNGIADKILRAMHMHPTKRCSKYCIGMTATGQVARQNRFMPALAMRPRSTFISLSGLNGPAQVGQPCCTF